MSGRAHLWGGAPAGTVRCGSWDGRVRVRGLVFIQQNCGASNAIQCVLVGCALVAAVVTSTAVKTRAGSRSRGSQSWHTLRRGGVASPQRFSSGATRATVSVCYVLIHPISA